MPVGDDAVVPGKLAAPPTKNLKRNFVVVGLGCGAGFWRRSRLAWPRFASAFGTFSCASAGAGRTAAKQLHRFADHAQLAPLLSALFVVPGVQLETAFDKNRPAFFQIFAGDFREPRPEDNIDIRDFFAFFAAIEGVLTVNGDAEVANGAAFGGITHFGIARQISEENNFIETGHPPVLADLLGTRQLFRRLFLPLLLFGLLAQALVVLTVTFRFELTFGTQFRNQLRICVENEVYIKTGIKRAGGIGKLAFVHFLHLLDFVALFYEFGFQTLDNVMHALLLALRVEDE